ncbi:ribbon-helix-helix domain-containing protein [Cryptosporangium minutisporangium]|uniref:Ribbon-helix-helix protein CopG domain-containing protein n=1 Tax=Cryptosporangium minutisporangium TaxID=113569 RepID=A0ABP6TBJ7_9ACTN
MSTHDADIEEALTSDDWSSAIVDREQRSARVTHTVQLEPDVSAALTAEADRRGMRPSEVLRELINSATAPLRAQNSPALDGAPLPAPALRAD